MVRFTRGSNLAHLKITANNYSHYKTQPSMPGKPPLPRPLLTRDAWGRALRECGEQAGEVAVRAVLPFDSRAVLFLLTGC